MSRSDWVFLVALSLSVATCGVIGVSYVAGEGWPILSVPVEILLVVVFTMLFAFLFAVVDFALNKLVNRAALGDSGVVDDDRDADAANLEQSASGDEDSGANQARKPRLAAFVPAWKPRSIVVFSLIMALFWLPWYIANFPGGTYWDTYYQIYQVYPENHPISIVPWEEMRAQTTTDAWIVDHHPALTTMLYGAFGWVSDQLTGNWMLGVAVFCALQGIVHIVVFTGAVAFVRHRACPVVLCFCSYLFFCIMPFISTWAMCMVKDSMFGVLFVVYFLMLFELVRTKGDLLKRPLPAIGFIVLGLFLCLTRKNGIFVVIPVSVIAAIVYRKNIKAVVGSLLQAACCLLVMCLVLPVLLFPALHIHPGGKQEILGPLLQQTARVAKDYGEHITPRERAEINRVIDYGRLAGNYQYDFEDAVKYRFDQNATPEDIAAYLKIYVKQGLQYPDSYLAAFASLAGFYVAPTAYANIRMVTVDTKMGSDQRYMLWNPDELDGFRKGLDDAYTTIASIPGLNLPLLIVTYVLWIPAALAYIAKRRRLKCGILFIPSIVLLAFCMISPVYDARYAVPLFDIAPLLLCTVSTLLYNAIQKKRRKHGE